MTLLIGLCVFSAALGRFSYLLWPFDYDAAIFIYMGKMVANGGRLCHDLIDNKFPTVGLMTSLVWKAFGTCWTAYVFLQALISLVAAAALARCARRTVGPHAWLPTMLFAVTALNFNPVVFGGFQLETLFVFFTVLSACAGIEMLRSGQSADAFTAGLCAGCGALLKPTAVGVLIALAIAAIIGNRRGLARQGFFVLAGLSIPLLVAFIYLQQADLLRDMPGLYHQISTYARETVFDEVELFKPIVVLTLLGFPILIRGYVNRRQHLSTAAHPPTSVVMFLVLWLCIETTGVILQRRMYAYHFMPMIPPAVLLFGLLPRRDKAASLAAALVPIALLSIGQAGKFMSENQLGEARTPISRYLIEHTKPGDAIWCDGWPRTVLETGLVPGAKLPFTFLFTNYDQAGLDYSAGIIADFQRTKPVYIVLPVQQRLQRQVDFIPELNCRPIRGKNYLLGWKRIEQYTLDHYEKETMLGNDTVYRRREP